MIEVTDHDGVAVVSLERPPVNALDLPMIEELGSAFARLADAPPRIGAVLTGGGKTFCAGVDTRAFVSYSNEVRRRMVIAITRMTSAVLSLSCPLVAAVNGHALGGGFVLMLCCDYRLAVDDSELRLGLTEARAGVPFPAGPVAIMRYEMPAALLRQMTLSSRVLSSAGSRPPRRDRPIDGSGNYRRGCRRRGARSLLATGLRGREEAGAWRACSRPAATGRLRFGPIPEFVRLRVKNLGISEPVAVLRVPGTAPAARRG